LNAAGASECVRRSHEATFEKDAAIDDDHDAGDEEAEEEDAEVEAEEKEVEDADEDEQDPVTVAPPAVAALRAERSSAEVDVNVGSDGHEADSAVKHASADGEIDDDDDDDDDDEDDGADDVKDEQ
jgi:hypothetical protein